MTQQLTDRPTLLDVTLRDGGYVNGHTWTMREAAAIVTAADAAGIPFIEVGYLRYGAEDPLRPAASCAPAYLDLMAGQARQATLAVMVRPGEAEPHQIADLADHGVGMVRVLVPGGDATRAAPYIAAARAAGLTVATNLTRASEASAEALAEAARRCEEAGTGLTYLADSNGSLYPGQVRVRIKAVAAATSVPVGFHAHDNLGLAFTNSCVAAEAGACWLDASIGGIGKGGGNLRLELIAGHLIVRHQAPFRLDPLAHCRHVTAAQLRMLADGGCHTLVAGLLDVNLDQARAFQEKAADSGLDALLRGLAAPTSPPGATPAAVPDSSFVTV